MKHSEQVSLDEQLVLSASFKRNVWIALGLGLLMFVAGVFLAMMGGAEGHSHAVEGATEAAHHGPTWLSRMWAVLWHNSVFFTGITAMGVFFVAVQFVAWAGWSSIMIRIPMAFGSFLPVVGSVLLAVFLLGGHDLFHWTHKELYDPNSPLFDSIINGKKGYLNLPFFLSRMVIFLVLWYLMWFLMRKNSLIEDLEGGDKWWHKNGYLGAVFLIIFGASTSMAAWDWIMSIDTHWFSTMFGWYVFASWWVTALSTITLICIFLKENGYLKAMNESHFHDLGKFVFAFSIFWTYVWFGQFLLIFYANIPEETTYFLTRLRGYHNHYTFLFYLNLLVNFFFPFFILMTRASKRKTPILKIAVIAVIFGHWLDFYMMIMPGVTQGTSGFGLMEFGALVTFASAFVLVVMTTMSKSKLIPVNHPMIEESIHHDIF